MLNWTPTIPPMDKLARPDPIGAGAALQKVANAFGTSPAMEKAAATLRDINSMLAESRNAIAEIRSSCEKIERADMRRAATRNLVEFNSNHERCSTQH